jgi:hypothetical protein
MFYYRLYCLNDAGRIYHRDDFDADDDAAAVEHASRLRLGVAAELWCGSRKVCSFEAAPEES